MGMSACFAWNERVFRAEVADSGDVGLYAGLPALDGPEGEGGPLGRGRWDSRVLRATWAAVGPVLADPELGQPFLDRAEIEMALCALYLQAVDRGEVGPDGDWEVPLH